MNIVADFAPPDIPYAVETSHNFAERCRRWLREARTEEDRENAREQLRSAEREIDYWQSRLEASHD
jgi:hypothetical protein